MPRPPLTPDSRPRHRRVGIPTPGADPRLACARSGSASRLRPEVGGRDGRSGPSSLTPEVVAVAISENKGVKKSPVPEIILRKGEGVVGDAHAGPGIRQVSLLAQESIEKMRRKGLKVGPGDFAENITTSGLNLPSLPLGTRLRLGKTALLEITQIGKECHSPCQIFYSAGECVMPREGIFAVVLRGGKVQPGDPIAPIGHLANPAGPKTQDAGR